MTATPSRRLVAVPCKLAPGMFSSELTFTVKMADGKEYRGIAPRHFCWNEKGALVSAGEVTQEVDGQVAARIVDDLDGDQRAVEVPDGEVIAVRSSAVGPRPTAIRQPGSGTVCSA